ncbi:Phage integrase family protein [Desulfonispora thiosulfatigenes DSM 11270]|uniref:Phage integrase family protein n=1 Tax=Desulfonispora thiosulfatigenes DSM 11270 TaxID=656914 RepID=A0A1W1UP47_DESTI|nr:Phage integrase family protein [Desulfonispora thiosulfatigenes DSM 11270]
MLFFLENRQRVSQRDRAAIVLLLYTGLRVSELVNLKTKDIDFLTAATVKSVELFTSGFMLGITAYTTVKQENK